MVSCFPVLSCPSRDRRIMRIVRVSRKPEGKQIRNILWMGDDRVREKRDTGTRVKLDGGTPFTGSGDYEIPKLRNRTDPLSRANSPLISMPPSALFTPAACTRSFRRCRRACGKKDWKKCLFLITIIRGGTAGHEPGGASSQYRVEGIRWRRIFPSCSD